jgi:hypothetical protein
VKDPIRELLELEATVMTVTVEAAQVSAAISLKRLADAAERLASCVEDGRGYGPEFVTFNRGNPLQ